MEKPQGNKGQERHSVTLALIGGRISHHSCPRVRNTDGNSFPKTWLYLERMRPSWTVVTLGQESMHGIVAITLICSRVSFMDRNDRKAMSCSRDKRLSIHTWSSGWENWGKSKTQKQTVGVMWLKLTWSRQPEARREDTAKLWVTQSCPAHA